MFKKPVDVKTVQRLSGADKKKLRRTAKERFPQASDADLDAILPPKGEITLAKYPNHALVYAIEGEFPMIFNIDARGHDLFPTVYALWKVPHLLPAFMLKGGEVSRYVIGGADLMFPGISIPPEGFPSFEAGQPWAVKVPGNPAPIAVGITTMSSTEALKAGLRGKALRILHYYRDMLWQVH
jgi:translation initiation factor 2D